MWRPYVPVAVRRARALREMNRFRKKGKDVRPVEIEGRTIARSVWGKRWCIHLESYSDYANRLPRGRAYVRNGSVCHLEVHPGRIEAIVMGSELYRVSVRIKTLKAAVWRSIKTRCSGQIGSMLELLQGTLSREVMSIVTDRERGLFPEPREIDFTCTCPDWAAMCKHVAAVLYGVGSRLDQHPESLFLLRGVDAEELIAAEMALPDAGTDDDSLADEALAGIFGIDIDIDMQAVSDTETVPPTAKAPATTRKGARQRDTSSRTARGGAVTTGRRAPRGGRAGDASPPRASAGRARTVASSTTGGGETSRGGTPGAASRPAGRASASGASAGRARKAASNAARGRKTPPDAAPRKRSSVGTVTAGLRPTGKSVTRLRKKLGLSVARFADRLGVSAATVYRWEATPGRLHLQARPLSALAHLHRLSKKSKKR